MTTDANPALSRSLQSVAGVPPDEHAVAKEKRQPATRTDSGISEEKSGHRASRGLLFSSSSRVSISQSEESRRFSARINSDPDADRREIFTGGQFTSPVRDCQRTSVTQTVVPRTLSKSKRDLCKQSPTVREVVKTLPTLHSSPSLMVTIGFAPAEARTKRLLNWPRNSWIIIEASAPAYPRG
jgi:hypothetical protein